MLGTEREAEAWSQRACDTRDPELCPEGYEEALKGSKEEKRLSCPVYILESCVGHREEKSRSELSWTLGRAPVRAYRTRSGDRQEEEG